MRNNEQRGFKNITVIHLGSSVVTALLVGQELRSGPCTVHYIGLEC